MEVATKKLGLAAFVKMHGGRLIRYSTVEGFVFDTDHEKTSDDWEYDYVNSCCHRHDTELVHLRKLMR